MTPRRNYLRIFLEEGAEILAKLYDRILRLENAPSAKEDLDTALRLSHTLKGGAKMVGLEEVSGLAHRLEGLLKSMSAPPGADAAGVSSLLKLLDEIQGSLALLDSAQASPEATDAPPFPAPCGKPETAPMPVAEGGGSERIRVSVARLDHLQGLIEDLTIQEARISTRLDRCTKELKRPRSVSVRARPTGLEEEGRRARALGAAEKTLAAVAEDVHELRAKLLECQNLIVSLRMVPLGDVLDEFSRTARQLARELGKEVSVTIDGRLTEVDRGLLERVHGPLRHLVRNAVDHGIESPSEREAARKNRCGQLSIRAYNRSSAVVIEVEDDGRGLDADAIREKAVREGALSAEEARSLADEQVFYLLCGAGFTTRDHVTEISGRGIGLDAVKCQMEAVRGSLDIHSEKGKYSRFRLFLPASISGLPALIVRAGTTYCALPTVFIGECVRFRKEELLGEGEAILHEGKALPLVSLGRVLGEAGPAPASSGKGISVVLLRFRGKCMPLQVDELVEEREVVLKALGDHLSGVPFVLGVSFMADEKPVPVINVLDLHPSWARLERACAYRMGSSEREMRALGRRNGPQSPAALP